MERKNRTDGMIRYKHEPSIVCDGGGGGTPFSHMVATRDSQMECLRLIIAENGLCSRGLYSYSDKK